MNETIYNSRAAIAMLIGYLFLSLLFTIELFIIDAYTKKEKLKWFLAIWLLPFFGPYWFYEDKKKHYKLKMTANNADDKNT